MVELAFDDDRADPVKLVTVQSVSLAIQLVASVFEIDPRTKIHSPL